ncbi:MAG: T9SS type A sorting domain-containing protein [Candidatus Zhuqueibacterota bacterium]
MKKSLLLFCLLCALSLPVFASDAQVAAFDTVSVRDIQFVAPESLAIGADDSYFTGDTVIVEGVVATGPRSLWAGARWSFILVDEAGGGWNGIQIIQNDTTKTGTNVTALKPGYKVRLTVLIEEYCYGVAPSHTQAAMLVNPPVPVELLGFGVAIPEPTLVTCAELAADVGEQYECTHVSIKNATVVNNNLSSNQMLIMDATGQLVVDDWSLELYDSLAEGSYDWPSNGTSIDIRGYIRSNANGNGFQIAPMSSADITILTNPPQISNVQRMPAAPTSNDDVIVSAKIKDTNGTVQSARLHYRIGEGRWQLGNMSATDSIYTRTIPKQPDGTRVYYFVKATDEVGDWAMMPGDTSALQYFYTVRDGGLTIEDLQWTPFKNTDSPYLGYVVTVSGVVSASPEDFLGDYILQDGELPWRGIWVNDAAHVPQRGDSVRVTGKVEENYNVTRLNLVTAFDSVGVGKTIVPMKITTGQATTGSAEAESYEGTLIQFDNVLVSDPFPDAPNNYGELEINDGTGGYRVDENSDFGGNFDSTYALNDRIETIIGIGWFSFYNYKLEPRNLDDVMGHYPAGVSNDRGVFVQNYALNQNYPNPFNPSTTIQFSIGANELVQVSVFNVLGQKIRSLVNEHRVAGQHSIQWDGLNEFGQKVSSGLYFYNLKAGDFVQTKKMILMQ